MQTSDTVYVCISENFVWRYHTFTSPLLIGVHLLDFGSFLSTIYPWTGFPPSFSGGSQPIMMWSLSCSIHLGMLGGKGSSVEGKLKVTQKFLQTIAFACQLKPYFVKHKNLINGEYFKELPNGFLAVTGESVSRKSDSPLSLRAATLKW